MRLLAIDTALAACSAAIFDFDKGVIASESLPMVRGHAEALMPLIGRVVDNGGYRIFRARPHRRHSWSRQFHRPARRRFCGAGHCARGAASHASA